MQQLMPHVDAMRVAPIGFTRAVLGIDPSLTGMAAALARPGLPVFETRVSSDPGSQVRQRVKRYQSLVRPIMKLARQYQPELVLIEGYARVNPRKFRGVFDRVELGGVLRLALVQHLPDAVIVEVSPTSLKKFAAGDGSASKAGVGKGLRCVYGRTFNSDDEADAYGLARIGLCVTGQSAPETEEQRGVVLDVIELVREAMAA